MHESLNLNKALESCGLQIRQVARLLAERGWAEANGGNLSFRLDRAFNLEGEKRSLSAAVPELDGQSLILTTAGSRMRDLADNPSDNLCLVKITDEGQAYIFQCPSGNPTSELPSHLAVHAALSSFRPDDRVFLHTHPTFLIALTHLICDNALLVSVLIRMFPEASLLLHNNLEILDYLTPGSDELGKVTADAVHKVSAVIWRGHGMVAVGKGFSEAFDIIETAEKAARVALLLGEELHHSGLGTDQLNNLYKAFEQP